MYHRPRPLRYVFHHILPQACGGKTEASNLVALCDNCHYAVHVLLWQLAQGTGSATGTRAQTRLATEGYAEAVAAGTAGDIPKEA
jgi:hypothetical protein